MITYEVTITRITQPKSSGIFSFLSKHPVHEEIYSQILSKIDFKAIIKAVNDGGACDTTLEEDEIITDEIGS